MVATPQGPQSGGGTTAGTTADLLRNQLLSRLVVSLQTLNSAIAVALGEQDPGGGTGPGTGGGGGLGTATNYIINGAMNVSIDANGAAVTTSGGFPVEMFDIQAVGTTFTAIQAATMAPSGSRNRLTLTNTSAVPTLAAGSYQFFNTKCEGFSIAAFLLGLADARTLTLRFGFNAPAGQYSVSIRNGTFNRAYIIPFTISPAEAGTDTLQTVTFTGDTAGTWAKGNVSGLDISWVLAAGSTFTTDTPEVWQNGNILASTGQSNFAAVSGNVASLFDVGLYLGDAAPATFAIPDIQVETARCNRYFYMDSPTLQSPAVGVMTFDLPYKATMRAIPTVTFTNNGSSGLGNAVVNATTANSVVFQAQFTASGGFIAINFRANARL